MLEMKRFNYLEPYGSTPYRGYSSIQSVAFTKEYRPEEA